MIYADTSFIASAYLSDAHTGTAEKYLTEHRPRLPLFLLHWPEMAKASAGAAGVWEKFKRDALSAEKFFRLEYDSARVELRAAGLMRNYAGLLAIRSLDALHVAAAIEAGCRTFLSFDDASNQRALAHDQTLKVWPPLSDKERERLKTPSPTVSRPSGGSN